MVGAAILSRPSGHPGHTCRCPVSGGGGRDEQWWPSARVQYWALGQHRVSNNTLFYSYISGTCRATQRQGQYGAHALGSADAKPGGAQ